MLIDVDPHSGIPVYRQLMDQIKFHVASGLLKPGDEVPSTRILSARLGVNPMTVSKAYNLLEREGVLHRRRGLPLVVKGHDEEQTRARKLEQLRRSLVPVVTMIRQLGIDPHQARQLFCELLDGETDVQWPEEGGDGA